MPVRGIIGGYGRYAGVAELADAQDLKSCEGQTSYRFDSGLRHHKVPTFKYRRVEQSGSSSGS